MSRPDTCKITNLHVRSFRGIPGELHVRFTDDDGKASSAIILGDNGTGKSSIVDAIEFGLQGQVQRAKGAFGSLKPWLPSLYTTNLPHILISLDSGETIERFIALEEEKMRVMGSAIASRFSLFPVVLRRSDILTFLTSSEVQRQVLFLSYLGDLKYDAPKNADPNDANDLIRQRVDIKRRRRDIAASIGKHLNLRDGVVPVSPSSFEGFVREYIFHGASEESVRGAVPRVILPRHIRMLVDEMRAIQRNLKKIETSLRPDQDLIGRQARLASLRTILANASEDLTSSFISLSTAQFIDCIEFRVGDLTDVSLSVMARLRNGKVVPPHRMLSEANLDLLALLVFLSLSKACANQGQAKVLVLDDVMQSVDSTLRLSIADYILQEFSDWQLIFTVHDRLWYEQLVRRFAQRGHRVIEKSIIRWSFNGGPVVKDGSSMIGSGLLAALDGDNPQTICAEAGLVLESTCHNLSWRLGVSIIRRQDDRYTLGDLWPAVYKALKRTSIKPIADSVDKWLLLRNLLGAHYNEWALSASLQDAQSLGEAVLELLWSTNCDRCRSWVEAPRGRTLPLTCRCGGVQIS